MKGYADLASLSEDDRIEIIGGAVIAGNIIGVAIENEPEKIARYIEKMTDRFPDVRHISTDPGLVPDTVLVRFGPPADN